METIKDNLLGIIAIVILGSMFYMQNEKINELESRHRIDVQEIVGALQIINEGTEKLDIDMDKIYAEVEKNRSVLRRIVGM